MSRSKRKRKLTDKEIIESLKVSLKLNEEQNRWEQKVINEAMRLMDKYKVPSNGKGGAGKNEDLSLPQRTQLLLRHLVCLETELLNLKQENEELEEEVDNLEFELTAALGEEQDEDAEGENDEQ